MTDAFRPTLDEWRVLALRLEQALACAVDSVRESDPMLPDYRASRRAARSVRFRDLTLGRPTEGTP